jgi:hypothetical protein
MRRRVILAVVSSALAGGTAGCLSFFDEQDVYLGRIAVTNQTQHSQIAHIKVYDNEESVFSTTEELNAYEVGEESSQERLPIVAGHLSRASIA